jgi:F-type H+-transporting ATPase subunit epsilon
MQLVVISPQKKVLETEITSVTIPTADGEITVLPNHMAIFSLLKPGEVIVRTKDGDLSITIGGGFVNVTRDKVTLLPEYGINSDEIDEEKVREAKTRAEEILKSKADEQSTAMAQTALARSLLELKVAQKRRKKS